MLYLFSRGKGTRSRTMEAKCFESIVYIHISQSHTRAPRQLQQEAEFKKFELPLETIV